MFSLINSLTTLRSSCLTQTSMSGHTTYSVWSLFWEWVGEWEETIASTWSTLNLRLPGVAIRSGEYIHTLRFGAPKRSVGQRCIFQNLW